MPARPATALAYGLVILAAVVPYLGSLRNGFVWDDLVLIETDSRIRTLRAALASFSEDFFGSAGHMGYYRPLVTLSFAGNFAISRLDPVGYHATNVLLHACASVLALALFRRLGARSAVAALGAALFAVHPVHTENVTWVSGRTDLLATTFVLLSAVVLLPKREARDVPAHTFAPSVKAVIVSSACYAAALLSKESAITLPFALFFYYVLVMRGSRRRFFAIVPHLALSIAYVAVRVLIVPPTITRIPIVPTVRSFIASLTKYLQTFFVPVGLTAYRQNPYSGWLDPYWLVGLAGLVVLAWVHVRPGSRRPTNERFTVIATTLAFAPLCNLIRVSSPADMGFPMADRFLYLPSIGLAIAGASMLHGAMGRALPNRRNLRWLIGAVLLGALGITTAARNRVWRDNLAFFQALHDQVDDSLLVDANYATALRRDGDPGEAERLLEKNLARVPVDSPRRRTLLVALAGVHAQSGSIDQARDTLLRLLEDGRDLGPIYFDLGLLSESSGNPEEALDWYRSALEADGNDAAALSKTMALAGRLGDRSTACAARTRLRELDPGGDWRSAEVDCN